MVMFQQALTDYILDHYQQEVLGWLTEYAAQCSDFLTRRQEGTGLWLLNSLEFDTWLSGAQTTLFCPGIPSSGKTIMASIVVEHLWKTFPEKAFPDHITGIAVLYCSYKGGEEQRDVNLLSALLKQLVQGQQLIPEPVKNLYDLHKRRQSRPSLDEISKSLLAIFKSYSEVFIINDALDECRDDDGTRTKLLSRIRNLQTHSNVKLMATSRLITKIEQEFKKDIRLDVRASNEDVERYLDSQMSQLPSCVLERPSLQQRIKTDIIKAADGMLVTFSVFLSLQILNSYAGFFLLDYL
jgi:Cdc6-like AAA superfamily ATPase